MTKPQQVFLLGGHDLEMITIKQLLEGRAGCVAIDKHLQWDNALLSAYQEELACYSADEIYGIELREDIPVPKNYCRIDHHNDYNDHPASVLQVAEVLGIASDWHIQLVAANDAGYIPAMQAMGASDKEIQEIRRLDRAAQGVTEEDEQLAEKSIAEGITRMREIVVVRSLTTRFSAICDRLFPYRRLLIYTDREWSYYGEGKTELVALLAKDIVSGKVFHGGGEKGYIGAAIGAFPTDSIYSFVNHIKEKYEQL